MSLVDIRYQATRRTPEEMLGHLRNFTLDLKFSAGVWFFAPGGGRFHDRYVDKITMEQVLEIAAALKPYGLQGLEAHYPNEVNEKTLPLFKKFGEDTGIRLITIVPNLFYDSQFEWGALSSPLPKVRAAAIQRTKDTLALNKEIGTDFAIVWPGIDGYENAFGLDLMAARDRFAYGLAEAMDAVPGVPVAEEPKPYEPRARILYGTTPEGILMAQKAEAALKNETNRKLLAEGHSLVGLNPEAGHVLMGYEDLAYAYGMVMEYGKLMHTHWNSQPLGNYDQDMNVGAISPEQTEAALYALRMYGYRGYFGIDINPERMPVDRALINCFDAMKSMNDRINDLDPEKIVFCDHHPDRSRGYLEALLIRARAPYPDRLSPLPDLDMNA
ncbi:MAG: TIM barrel protein [Armatimonadetes bacterium]|nr:TIM barrel protein [Armatimonadota bacterium]